MKGGIFRSYDHLNQNLTRKQGVSKGHPFPRVDICWRKRYASSAQAAVSVSGSDLPDKTPHCCTSATSYFQLRNKKRSVQQIRFFFFFTLERKNKWEDLKTKGPINLVSCLSQGTESHPSGAQKHIWISAFFSKASSLDYTDIQGLAKPFSTWLKSTRGILPDKVLLRHNQAHIINQLWPSFSRWEILCMKPWLPWRSRLHFSHDLISYAPMCRLGPEPAATASPSMGRWWDTSCSSPALAFQANSSPGSMWSESCFYLWVMDPTTACAHHAPAPSLMLETRATLSSQPRRAPTALLEFVDFILYNNV